MLSGLIEKYDPRHMQRIQKEIAETKGSSEIIEVECFPLNDLLRENRIENVNYLSIDTEGGEFDILSSIDFSKVTIDVISVEDNYGDTRFYSLMEEKGFVLVNNLHQDLIFVNKKLL